MDKSISISLSDKVGKAFKFETLKQLHHFIKSERGYWEDKQKKYSNPNGQLSSFINAGRYFQQFENTIDSWNDKINDWDEQTLKQQLSQSTQQLTQQLRSGWLWQGHPFIEPWFSILENHSSPSADVFINYFINNGQIGNITTKDQLKGAVLAYEFDLQDENSLTRRRNAEKKSISKVRNDLISANGELFKDVAEFQNDFHQWDESTRSDAEKLYRVNKKLGERRARQQSGIFDELLDTWTQKITELEETYREKLRLEQPATYWKNKAEDYSKSGKSWMGVLALVVLLGVLGLGFLFWGWLNAQDVPIELNSLQGVVLFIAIISSYAFLLKTISRLVFSSFHLQRDAEEREQLTHVYLALTHENNEIDQEARNIVLQALFSRADTGLLRGDSSPTMPGLHEIVKAGSSR